MDMIQVEPITERNALQFKAVRLQALQESPTAFASTYARESQFSDSDWLSRAVECISETFVGYLAIDAKVACGIVLVTPDDQDTSAAWVESMWVPPSHRRLGVGRLLINTILAWGRNRGVRVLKLMVTSNNEPAICFYQRVGFSLTGNTEPYANDPTLIECEMLQPLS